MNLGVVEDYAVRALVDLARHSDTRVADIAQRTGVPVAHLAKVVQSLVRAGLVETTRGRRGGVRLARPADDIVLREVIEAVQGPLRFLRCPRRGIDCPRDPDCPLLRVWLDLEASISSQLESVRLADLLVSCGRACSTTGCATAAKGPR
jgi:Rrf2 family transcriptional regulator, iron-sulfur cluster assembly transcription factor